MAILYTGEIGIKLSDVITKLGNKSYDFIDVRCEYVDQDGNYQDDFIGACSYDSKTNKLIPLDGDSYSLDDLYIRWKESFDNDGNTILTVWEHGEFE